MTQLSEEKIRELFEVCLKDADKMLAKEGALLEFAGKLEKKLADETPEGMARLGRVPHLAERFKACVVGEGTELEAGDLRNVLAALIYYVMPYDIIPDRKIVTGYADDAAIGALAEGLCHFSL